MLIPGEDVIYQLIESMNKGGVRCILLKLFKLTLYKKTFKIYYRLLYLCDKTSFATARIAIYQQQLTRPTSAIIKKTKKYFPLFFFTI